MLEGSTLLVAGAGPGLGAEVARCGLREGANVVLGARDAARLEEIAKELDPTGKRVLTQSCDVTHEPDCARLAEAAASRFGRIDALVCVAARVDVLGSIEDTTLEGWRDVYETNVIGTVSVIRAALPALKAQGGAIVMIGSQSEVLPKPAPGFIAYGGSKAALHSAMIYMAEQLGPHGIRVNTVVPSTMWSPTLEGYAVQMAEAAGRTLEEVRSDFEQDMPLGSMPEAADVAEAVAFLCSERARRITGQQLFVNSGEWMR
jgi:NAD(P)-dependent dehydrogenase (short-subunit alcohol dehydrogenase family)